MCVDEGERRVYCVYVALTHWGGPKVTHAFWYPFIASPCSSHIFPDAAERYEMMEKGSGDKTYGDIVTTLGS